MSLDRESRTQRIINVGIAGGVLAVISAMVATPQNGPNSWFDSWLVNGLPLLAIGLIALAIAAPRYIRGGAR